MEGALFRSRIISGTAALDTEELLEDNPGTGVWKPPPDIRSNSAGIAGQSRSPSIIAGFGGFKPDSTPPRVSLSTFQLNSWTFEADFCSLECDFCQFRVNFCQFEPSSYEFHPDFCSHEAGLSTFQLNFSIFRTSFSSRTGNYCRLQVDSCQSKLNSCRLQSGFYEGTLPPVCNALRRITPPASHGLRWINKIKLSINN